MKGDHHPAQAPKPLQRAGLSLVPVLFVRAGERSSRRFIEFFTAEIRNPNTRTAYARAVSLFASWCELRGFMLESLTPVHVAAYVERLGAEVAKPTVKQHLAAIRMLFDYLVVGQVIPMNPASSVRGPKYVIKKGKTPVLTAKEARQLFDEIDQTEDEDGRPRAKAPSEMTIAELRDRAVIATMLYTFARVSAVIGMNVEDFVQRGRRSWVRLHEKGGKWHEVPAHHNLDEYLHAYLEVAAIAGEKGTPLFRRLDRRRRLTGDRLDRREALAMIKRRARRAGFGEEVCCHTFRATGITAYLENDGTVEGAQAIAAHESPRTTKLYDRTSDAISLDEVEKIQI
jgi:integrase/recombinase XerD